MDKKTIMIQWDKWRHYIAKGGTSSWPRDEFENLIANYEECISNLKSELKEANDRWRRYKEADPKCNDIQYMISVEQANERKDEKIGELEKNITTTNNSYEL